jgi:putative ABC transport system permease protein
VQSGWSNWYRHYREKNFMQEKFAAVDPSFFDIFPFPFMQGDPKTALEERHSIVLTEELARKSFVEEDHMGKILQIGEDDMKVTGVIENIPRSSRFQFDYAFPIINMSDWRSSKMDDWKYTQFATYVKLGDNSVREDVEQKISGIVKTYDADSKLELYLQPLGDIHLRSSHLNSWMVVYPGQGDITYVYIFLLISLCIFCGLYQLYESLHGPFQHPDRRGWDTQSHRRPQERPDTTVFGRNHPAIHPGAVDRCFSCRTHDAGF